VQDEPHERGEKWRMLTMTEVNDIREAYFREG
jgi:hypothetical protein